MSWLTELEISSQTFVHDFDSELRGASAGTFASAPFSITKNDGAGLRLERGILVHDPPRAHLLASLQSHKDLPLELTPYPGNAKDTSVRLGRTSVEEGYITPHDNQPKNLQPTTSELTGWEDDEMARKRRSLSIFIPSFLQVPLSPTSPPARSSNGSRMRSHSSAEQSLYYHPASYLPPPLSAPLALSPRNSPPPQFLIDDDPFANLSAKPSLPPQSPEPPIAGPLKPLDIKSGPRSPLTPTPPETMITSPTPAPTSIDPVTVISHAMPPPGRQPRPAYRRPAFAPRPSLPSLNTLARMNVVVPIKVRKGRVGARLPHEPWNDMDPDNESSFAESSLSPAYVSAPVSPAPSRLAHSTLLEPDLRTESHDFVADLDLPDDSEEDDTLALFAQDIHFSTLNPLDLSLSLDTESSMVGDPPVSPTHTSSSPELLSPLSRSTSSTSSSSRSSRSDVEETSFPYQSIKLPLMSYNGSHETIRSSSAESDELPNSPPDDYFSFPAPRYPLDSISDFDWDNRPDCESHDMDDPPRMSLFSDVHFPHEPELTHEPGTSAGTIRAAVHAWVNNRRRSPAISTYPLYDEEAMDAGGWERSQGGDNRNYSSRSGGQGYSGGDSGRGYQGQGGGVHGSGGRGMGGRGDDDDDRRDDKRRGAPSSFLSPSSSEPTTDEEDDSLDEQSQAVAPTAAVAGASGSDDDIPLAQRIPTALTAQRTIRRQVREERDQRRKDRALRAEQTTSPRSRQTTLRPAVDSQPQQTAISSSREAATHAASSTGRLRTRTLPSSTPRPFTPEDLAAKLQNVQVTEPSMRLNRKPSTSRHLGRSLPDQEIQQLRPPPPSNPHPEGAHNLRPSRSFHKPQGRQVDDYRSVPMPTDDEQKIGRSLTRARSKYRDDSQTSSSGQLRTPPAEDALPKPYQKVSTRVRTEHTGRSSGDHDRHLPSSSRQLTPAHPPVEVNRGPVTQQRIFIGDMQRFNMVELTANTNAGDVIEMVEAQGSLKGWVGAGGWMVWEVAQDFGMERPIRSFELLSDIQSSWNMDKTVNTFVLKITPLAVPLSRSVIPTSAPAYSGYVEWESKRGKWSKRYMRMRDHNLYLCKRENGKDEVFLCSLSNFDVYFVTRPRKAPKPFVFAIKSADNLSFFENTADYLHVFSCSQKDGDKWVERILVARSYVLQQERNVLFNPKVSLSSNPGASSLSRAGTRRTAPHRPAQTLITPPNNDVFEPGSLLHKGL